MSSYFFLFDKKSEAKNNYVSALHILPTVFLALQSKTKQNHPLPSQKQNHPLWCVNGFKTRDTFVSYSCLWKVPTAQCCGDAPAVKQFVSLWNLRSPQSQKLEICLHTVDRFWALPHNKHQTTSSESSAQWPTGWSKEACSPCWTPPRDLGVRPTLKPLLNMVLAKRHQSGEVLSRANVSQTLKTKGRFRFAEKQPV